MKLRPRFHRLGRSNTIIGTVVEHHYAQRGGPRIWDWPSTYGPNTVEYVEAYRAATTAKTAVVKGSFQDIINEFFELKDFSSCLSGHAGITPGRHYLDPVRDRPDFRGCAALRQTHPDRLGIRSDLRLYDARGTAVT
ncbi:hypothetical protein SAMN04488004_11669 [Loktanella salsilacus]|uniref:Uncharacterized protein n=2 Tax=Loktanella salsilacus TaxID=195913 RepID=A0A1I4H8A1_9RHOB|nr:hypothetical protein SAMN04488004_11669 [Loktanella salsilacus]